MTKEEAYRTSRKVEIIRDILAILFSFRPERFKNFELEGDQGVAFSVSSAVHSWVEKRYVIKWDNKLNFYLYELGARSERIPFHPPTSAWFEVRDLLREEFLDAEKLKI